ncbi:ribosome silencing factor [Rhodoferax sp.]|uniref:ribosome silencing factor n=1 Tax=Rhodoferax sp. TaxID=50421 RepID=UPI0026192069|nr:ribosome silencing factor [Rhodoferax sp.]MDD3935033.1 ribosome silencing factor [Rhodoferax sp.]
MTTKTTAPGTAKKPAKAAAKSAISAASKSLTKPVAKPASATVEKKDVQKLQRAIVDGLEDVKAQDIVVFDTEHLSSLFERVIVASGTSNRQTKALAMSVIDAVRDAGFAKPRVEGEANGEWIIVDCGQAVVHVMQPTYRSYYNLEELWGDKPVRLKFGAAKPVVMAEPSAAKAKAAKEAAKPAASLRRSSAAKQGVQEAFPSRAQMAKTAAAEAAAVKKTAAKTAATPRRKVAEGDAVAKPRLKTLVVNAPVKPAAKKSAAKTVAKKAPAKKSAVRKA